jgi:hypothetical protein
MLLPNRLSTNPILRRAQRQTTLSRWGQIERAGILLVPLGVFLVLVFIYLDWSHRIHSTAFWFSSPPVQLYVTGVHFAVYVVTTIRFLWSGSVIAEEDLGRHWDMLILTPITSVRYVLGCWHSAVYASRYSLLILGLTRLILILLVIYSFNSSSLLTDSHLHLTCVINAQQLWKQCIDDAKRFVYLPERLPVSRTLIALSSAIAFSILELGTSSLLGFAARVIVRQRTLAFIGAMVARMGIPLFFMLYYLYLNPSRNYLFQWQFFTATIVTDGGMTGIFRLIFCVEYFRLHRAVYPTIATALMYTVLLAGSLGLGLWAVRRRGMLPHPVWL